MKRLLLSSIFTIYSVTAWCQYPHSHIQDLHQVAQVTLPDTPTVRHTKRGIVYTVSYDDLIYTASGASIKETVGDVIQNTSLDSIYVGAIKGIVRSTSGALIYQRQVTEQGLKGMEFETSAASSGTNFHLFYRIFYFNDQLVMQGMWCPPNVQRSDSRIKTYFDTFKVKVKPADIKQGTGVIIFAAVKYALIVVLILAAIVALIVFLARRSNSRTTQ